MYPIAVARVNKVDPNFLMHRSEQALAFWIPSQTHRGRCFFLSLFEAPGAEVEK